MKRLLLLLLITLACSFPIAAQEEATEEEKEGNGDSEYYIEVEREALEIPTMNSTASKLPVSLLFTPASVGVVNEQLLRVQDARVLSDALRNISGVNVQSGFGTFDFFTVRGMDSLSTSLILTDGAPEPESTFFHLYNVERVEMLKGPGAFLYGGNPLSGSVNLIRKLPEFGERFVELGNSFGQFTTYYGTVDANISNSDEDLAFRVNGTWQTSDFYRDNKDNDNFAVNPAFAWQISDDSKLNINFEYVHNDYKPDAGIPLFANEIPDVERTNSYQSPFDKSDQDLTRIRADYETKINDSLTLRNKIYNTTLDWQTDGTLYNGAFPIPTGNVLVARTFTLLDDRQNMFGDQFEAVWNLQTGSVQHQLLTGFEINVLDDEFTLDVALLPTIDLFNPIETATEPVFVIPQFSQAGDARSVILAPYFVDQITLSEQFRIFAGGRFDNLDYEDKVTGTDRSENQFSPMFGVVYSPRNVVSLYFNAGKGFAPPSSLTVGERKAEESTQYEIGVKTEMYDGKWTSSFAFYNLQRDNIAIPDNTGITREIGDQESRGFEVEVHGRPSPEWNTTLCYSYNDSELTSFAELVFTGTGFIRVDRSGNTPAFAPQHILNAWVTRLFDNGFGVGVGPQYVSSQFIAEDNAYEIDGYFTLDAAVFYDLDRWRFSLNFRNLTDTEYEVRGFGANSVTPANPFAVYAGVDFRL